MTKKFTSEDLLKAMGLKVGQRIIIDNYREGIIIFDKVYGVCVDFDGIVNLLNWLIGQNYTIIQPKPTLTEDEKVILKNIPKEFKWIARDEDGKRLMICTNKPEKTDCLEGFGKAFIMPYYMLFQFIKWEDEPYSIEELLKE